MPNNSLRLADVKRSLPSFEESAQCAERLRAAMFEGITEADMKEIVKAQVDKAKGGDSKAAKTVFDMVAHSGPRVAITSYIGVSKQAAGPSIRALPAAGEGKALAAGDRHAIRLDCAKVLGKEGPCTVEDLADSMESVVTEEEIQESLSSDATGLFDFDEKTLRWRLTELGRKELLAAV